MIRFLSDTHKYESIEGPPIDWIGVSSLIGFFKLPFDPVARSVKASRNSRSKWYKMEPEAIRSVWKRESDRSLELGIWYHNKTEDKLLSSPVYTEEDRSYNVVKPLLQDGIKLAPEQRLEEGHIYPEHLIYLQSEGICGQTDRVEVLNGICNIRDYKSSKTIKTEGFRNWEGITQRMMDPLTHLDDCSMVHYSLQLSLYMYMILKHNPHLKPGKLTIDHIIFELEDEDQYGYPIYKQDSDGNFIVKEIKPYEVPYMKMEVITIIATLRENRELIKSKIYNL
jgi:hypothetical protein